MRHVIRVGYSFKELIEAAKQEDSPVTDAAVEKVRAKLIEWSADSESIQESVWPELWKKALEAIGFEDAELSWTGFWSQGDGASFTASVDVHRILHFLTTVIEPQEGLGKEEEIDWQRWVVHRLKRLPIAHDEFNVLKPHADDIYCGIKRHGHHYSHERTCRVEVDGCISDEIDPVINDFEKAVESLRYDLCCVIYKDLNDANDALSEDESLISLDECNNYLWDAGGGRLE